MAKAEGVLNWILDKIFSFFNYYSGIPLLNLVLISVFSLDLNKKENELRERADDLRATKTFGKEKKLLILHNTLNKQSLKRYGQNRLMPTYKAFLRRFSQIAIIL